MATFSFEKLEVWKKSAEFIVKIYRTTESFPDSEKFGLTSQIRRASVSIASNIAEGSSRNTPKGQGRFYNIAYSSAIEVLNQLILSKKLKILNQSEYKELRSDLEEVTRTLNGLYQTTRK